jgi:hypothetical protein
VLDCGAYLDHLERARLPLKPRQPGEVAKPERVSGEEMQHWLGEFKGLADDPALKELFDLPGLEE